MEGKRHPAPPSIIVENPTTINRAIRRKHYFFYEIIKDGILLYNDGTFQIGKPEKLPYREIKQYAEEEYAECFPLAEGFLRHGHLDKEEENYKLGSFELHQACERYYKTFTLVYSGIRPKSHELKVLGAMFRSCSLEFSNVFPILSKIIKHLINYAEHISKPDIIDCSPLAKSNTSICWHEQRCSAK